MKDIILIGKLLTPRTNSISSIRWDGIVYIASERTTDLPDIVRL